MTKIITTIYIKKDLKNRAKERGITISQFVNQKLEQHLDELDGIEINQQRDIPYSIEKEISKEINKQDNGETNEETQEIFGKLSNIPEAHLKLDQLDDYTLLIKVVDHIRKHHKFRVGVSHLVEFNKKRC